MIPMTRDILQRRRATRFLIACASLAALAACARDKGAEAPATPEGGEPAGGAITLWTDSTELFMEHPALIVGAPDKFAVHLTDLTDFAPLRSGRITGSFGLRLWLRSSSNSDPARSRGCLDRLG